MSKNKTFFDDYEDDYDDFDDEYYEDDQIDYVELVKNSLVGSKTNLLKSFNKAGITKKLEEYNYDTDKTINFFKREINKSMDEKTKATQKPTSKDAKNQSVQKSIEQNKSLVAKCEFDKNHSQPGYCLSDDELMSDNNFYDSKEYATLLVSGHVDSGKSTLVGHLMYKIGEIKQKDVRKFQKESQAIGKSSFYFAWAMDSSQTEREHGITMDIAERQIELENRCYTIIDSPGHRDFIPNMIKGAYQSDLAILVIPATPGEYETSMQEHAQTREHAILLKALGVEQIILTINKMDMTSPDPWSQERFDKISFEVKSFLVDELHFDEKNIHTIPISGLLGANIISIDQNCPMNGWYRGSSLVQLLNNLPIPKKPIEKPFRAVVTRGNHEEKDKIGNDFDLHVLQGRITTGRTIGYYEQQGTSYTTSIIENFNSISVNEIDTRRNEKMETLKVEPNSSLSKTEKVDENFLLKVVKVASISNLDGLRIPSLLSGQSGVCKFQQMSNKEQHEIQESMILFKGPPLLKPVMKFKANIITLSSLELPIIPGAVFEIYLHGSENECKVYKILPTEGKKRVKCILKNSTARVTLTLTTPVSIESFSSCKSLGRFALRSKGQTIAVGICE